jgi:hypothetical protein
LSKERREEKREEKRGEKRESAWDDDFRRVVACVRAERANLGGGFLVFFLEISVDLVAWSAKCMQQQAMSGSSLLCGF